MGESSFINRGTKAGAHYVSFNEMIGMIKSLPFSPAMRLPLLVWILAVALVDSASTGSQLGPGGSDFHAAFTNGKQEYVEGRYDQALLQMRRALSLASTDSEKGDALFYLSLGYYAVDDIPASTNHINSLLALDSTRRGDADECPRGFEFLFSLIRAGQTLDSLPSALSGKSRTELLYGMKYGIELARQNAVGKKDLSATEKLLEDWVQFLEISDLDVHHRNQLIIDILFLRGSIELASGHGARAVERFTSMYERSEAIAKEKTAAAADPKVERYARYAEDKFFRRLTQQTLSIITQPPGVDLLLTTKNDGQEKKTRVKSPHNHTIKIDMGGSPVVAIEINEPGYKPYSQVLEIMEPELRTEIVLERITRPVKVTSTPPGARVFVDGNDTGLMTDCTLDHVGVGPRVISLEKPNYRRHELSIEVKESGEVQTISATLPGVNYSLLAKLGGTRDVTFNSPTKVAVDREDSIYVIDSSGKRIQKFRKSLVPMPQWSKNLKNYITGPLMPGGIAADNLGYIYITDYMKNCIHKFSSGGQKATGSPWGGTGSGKNDLLGPKDIAVDTHNQIYVVDTRNNRIKIYSSDGKVLDIWGGKGSTKHAFEDLRGVAVDSKDQVYVLTGKSVQKFTSNGEPLATWGKSGSNPGEFMNAMGIAVDQQGYVYITEWVNSRIQKFDGHGEFVTMWGEPGDLDHQMKSPSGIAINSLGQIFVADRELNLVRIYAIPDEHPSK